MWTCVPMFGAGAAAGEPQVTSFTESTAVEFADLPLAAIEAYVESGAAFYSWSPLGNGFASIFLCLESHRMVNE